MLHGCIGVCWWLHNIIIRCCDRSISGWHCFCPICRDVWLRLYGVIINAILFMTAPQMNLLLAISYKIKSISLEFRRMNFYLNILPCLYQVIKKRYNPKKCFVYLILSSVHKNYHKNTIKFQDKFSCRDNGNTFPKQWLGWKYRFSNTLVRCLKPLPAPVPHRASIFLLFSHTKRYNPFMDFTIHKLTSLIFTCRIRQSKIYCFFPKSDKSMFHLESQNVE